MFRSKRFSITCDCGERLEALSREGMFGLLRTHVLFEHGKGQEGRPVDKGRPVLEVVSQ